MIPSILTRPSLWGLGLHHCHPLHQLVQQPQPLLSLRSFSLNPRPTSILVRAQAIAEAPRTRPASRGFNQLGLGEELLAFLAEHNLHTPTEIQVLLSSGNILNCDDSHHRKITQSEIMLPCRVLL